MLDYENDQSGELGSVWKWLFLLLSLVYSWGPLSWILKATKGTRVILR